MARPKKQTFIENTSKNLYEWNGIVKGDPVLVSGHSKLFSFTFWSMTPDEEGVAKSVCVFGGTYRYEQFRHFLPERISAAPKARIDPRKTAGRNKLQESA